MRSTCLIGVALNSNCHVSKGIKGMSERLSLATSGQSQTSKKIPQTDAIFNNIQANNQQVNGEHVKRLSIDCKAIVIIGEYARGGKTRGDNQAIDRDFGAAQKYIRARDCR